MGRLKLGIALLTVLLLVGGASINLMAVEKNPADFSLLERTCTDCHNLEQITAKKGYFAEWQIIVDRMAAYDGSEISQIDKLKVLKYIKENLATDGPGGRARQKVKDSK